MTDGSKNGSKKEQAIEASDRLKHSKEEILARWEALVRRELDEARRESKLTLRDSLPKFIDRLAEALREQELAGSVRSSLLQIASEHADDRASHTDYTLEQIIREYEILRKIIFEVLEREQLLHKPERETILDAVTTGMAQATGQFAEVAAKREEQIQEQLEETEGLFQTVFQLAASGKAIVDAHTQKFLRVNKKLCSILGYSEDELKKIKFTEITHPDDRKWQRELFLQRVSEKSEGWSLEKRYVKKDGSIVWVFVSGAVLLDKQGQPAQIVTTVQDISKRKAAEEQLRVAEEYNREIIERLQEERRLREQFVNTLTHDLRTPLSVIRIATQILEMDLENSEQLVRTKQILKNVAVSDQMIQDLLDANKLRAGRGIAIDIQATKMSDVVEAAAQNLEVVYGDRFELSVDGDCQGFWCPIGIRRITENLATNAIKYGAADTPVKIGVKDLGDRVQLCVHNSGPAISEEEQKNLFEQFSRAKAAETSGKKGWGIGLTIVKGIADAHCAEIRLTSHETEGTTFLVTFPRDSRPCRDEWLKNQGGA